MNRVTHRRSQEEASVNRLRSDSPKNDEETIILAPDHHLPFVALVILADVLYKKNQEVTTGTMMIADDTDIQFQLSIRLVKK